MGSSKEGFKGAVICTPPTKDLAELLLLDAAHLQEEDTGFLNRKGLSKHKPALPLFDTQDAQDALALLTTRPYDQWTELSKRISFRFLNAGHLLGSAMVGMEVSVRTGSQGSQVNTHRPIRMRQWRVVLLMVGRRDPLHAGQPEMHTTIAANS